MNRVLIDGGSGDAELAQDRGLAYGDGLFETMAFSCGEILAWDAHLARLDRGRAVLALAAVDPAVLHAECLEVAAGLERAVVKLILTRGTGGRGYRPPARPRVRRIVAAHPWPKHVSAASASRTRVWICTHPLGINRRTAGIKHLNRLDQVLASAEWPADDFFEGLMLDPDGRLVEGTRSNVFIVRDGRVSTPWLGRCGVRGIVRDAVIAGCARLGIDCVEQDMEPAALRRAEEVFLTNSVIGVRSVTHIEAFGTPALEPGPVAARLAATLRATGTIP